MASVAKLQEIVSPLLSEHIHDMTIANQELTLNIMPDRLIIIATILRDHPELEFELLIDVCGVDYLTYGQTEWITDSATALGFERASLRLNRVQSKTVLPMPERFAVVYHLLSIKHNHRIRLKAFLKDDNLTIESVTGIWPAANWFERETFDLYGIFFNDHPDLRRILTDYGFIGYPFRKDFPLIGTVEMRYDATAGRVIYEPVSIAPRTLVPRVIREDNRYIETQEGAK